MADWVRAGQERQEFSAVDGAGEFGEAEQGPARLTGQDQAIAPLLAEYMQIAHMVSGAHEREH